MTASPMTTLCGSCGSELSQCHCPDQMKLARRRPIALVTTEPSQVRQRDRGDGSIFKVRNSKNWYVQFYDRGRPVRISAGSEDYNVAKRLLRRKLAEKQTGTLTPARLERIRVSELFEDALVNARTRGNKSIDDVAARWKLHLAPFLGAFLAPDGRWRGGHFAAQVTTPLIERYIASRQSEGAANASIRRELALLRRMFKLGQRCRPPKVKDPLVFEMPGNDGDNVRCGFLEPRDRERLAQECSRVGLWMRAIFELGCTWGMRKEEILRLRISQVDLFSNTVRLLPNTTKSKKGRTLTMTQSVRELLSACIAGRSREQYVFVRGRDNHRVADFRTTWYDVCVRAGLGRMCCPECVSEEDGKPIPLKGHDCPSCSKWWNKHKQKYDGLIFHDLRRSAVRAMIRAGISSQIAMAISGHETDAIFRRYDITSQSDIAAGMKKLEAAERETRAQLEEERESAGHRVVGNYH